MHKRFAVPIALLAAAIPVTTAIAGSPTDRATGGGQILVSSDGRGAGDTIAFTARGTTDAATGEIQYVDRSGGTGVGQSVLHGSVSCLNVDGNTAKLAGVFEDGSAFTMVVVDNGEGALADDDTIALQKVDDPTCDRQNGDDDSETALARGNAQVYDAG